MKILIINTLYHPYQIGGAEKSVQILAEYFLQSGNSVSVFTLTDGSLPDCERVNCVDVIRSNIDNIYWPFDGKRKNKAVIKFLWHLIDLFNIKAAFKAFFVMKKLAPEVVLSNNISGFSVSIWISAILLKIPVVHVVRDYYLLNPDTVTAESDSSIANIPVLLFKTIKRSVSQKIKTVVFISKYIERIHRSQKFFENAKTFVVYNSVKDIKKLPRKNHSFRFGFLGRVEFNKGIEVLLKAYEMQDAGCSLHIAGNSEERYSNYLKDRFKSEDIFWYDFLDASQFFEKIDFLVVPSVWPEPLGRVVLESYSFGVPVIVSNSGGLPEIVVEEETGLSFDSGSSIALKFCMQRILEMNYELLSKNCLNYAEAFSCSSIGAQYHKILIDVCRSGAVKEKFIQ